MTEPLSKEDLNKIKNCDDYLSTKRIMKSHSDYADYEVGTAIFIKYTRGEKSSYEGLNYDGSGTRSKYLIVHKDEGFLFAKRIIASGKPGVEIICLTIKYPSDSYTLEVDENLLDAMLLDNMDNYDPTAEAKELAKKKNKASRENAKKRIIFGNVSESFTYLTTLKIGDKLWTCSNSFGGYISEYEIVKSDYFVLDPLVKRPYAYYGPDNSPHPHQSHIDQKFSTGYKVEIKELNARYTPNIISLYFYTITDNSDFKCGYQTKYYSSKPVTPEEIL